MKVFRADEETVLLLLDSDYALFLKQAKIVDSDAQCSCYRSILMGNAVDS